MFYFSLENIKLENGKYLSRLFGKYLPNLILITDKEYNKVSDIPNRNERLEEYFGKYASGQCIVWEGEYRKNQKGNDIFDFTKKGHILISIDWQGRRTNPNLDLPKLEPLYHRIASSNGGGTGITYYIFPEDIKIEGNLREDDF